MEVLTHLNSGPTVTGVIIKKQGPNSTPPPPPQKKKKKKKKKKEQWKRNAWNTAMKGH